MREVNKAFLGIGLAMLATFLLLTLPLDKSPTGAAVTISATCDSCTTCTTCASTPGNTCTLLNSMNRPAGNCITVTADDVIIDCDGNDITTSSVGGDGVLIDASDNVIVRNCGIAPVDNGVVIRDGSDNAIIEDNTMSSDLDDAGVVVSTFGASSNNVIIRRNTISDFFTGIHIRDGANAMIYQNSIIRNDNWGVRIGGSGSPGSNNGAQVFANGFGLNGGTASFVIKVFEGGVWKKVAIESMVGEWDTRTINLPKAVDKVRIEHRKADTAHIDHLTLDGEVPSGGTDLSTGESIELHKYVASDDDVADATKRTLEFVFKKPGTELVLNAVESNIEANPKIFPNSRYEEYVVGLPYQRKHLWAPSSPHPTGYIYDTFMSDGENLYVFSDVTTDNTLDIHGDWTELIVSVDGEDRTFRISPTDSTWGVQDFVYNDKVNYQHKTYQFAIPLSAIGAKVGDTIKFKMAYYGTSASPSSSGLLIEQNDNVVAHSNTFSFDDRAINIVSANNVSVYNNSINSSNNEGIRFQDNSGIGAGDSQFARVENNTINSTTEGILVESSDNNVSHVFIGNGIYNTSSTGIRIVDSRNVTFNHTIIESFDEWIRDASGFTEYDNTTFFNGTAGSINLPGNFSFTDEITSTSFNPTQDEVQVSSNFARITGFVGDDLLSVLNQSGIITFFNLSGTSRVPRVDLEDNGSFVNCPGSRCTLLSFSGGVMVFNVTGWTTYSSLPDTPASINVSITKTDAPDPVSNGSGLNYTITVNVTSGTAINVTLQEFYPAGTTFNNSQPSPVSGDNTLFLGNLTNGTSFTVNLTVNVSASASNGATLTNTVELTYFNSTGGNVSVNESTTTTVSAPSPPAPTPAGGGGGGGLQQFQDRPQYVGVNYTMPYNRWATPPVQTNDVIDFKVGNEGHSITVKSVSIGQVRLIVSSTPQEVILSAGNPRLVDLNFDGNPDLSIEAVEIQRSTARLNIEVLSEGATEEPVIETPAPVEPEPAAESWDAPVVDEPEPVQVQPAPEPQALAGQAVSAPPESESGLSFWWLLVAIGTILGIMYFVIHKMHPPDYKKTQSRVDALKRRLKK